VANAEGAERGTKWSGTWCNGTSLPAVAVAPGDISALLPVRFWEAKSAGSNDRA
jgi:hypothetical protein